jgi:hypothetical protein
VADASPERHAREAGVRDRAGYADEIVKCRLVIDIASVGTCLDINQLVLGIDSDGGHFPQINYEGVIRHPVG